MKERDIDDILKRAAPTPEMDPVLLARVVASLPPSMGPVRPLPPTRVLAAVLFLTGSVVAAAGAARAGFQGVQAMGNFQRVPIFISLAILSGLSSWRLVAGMIPGTRRRISPGALLLSGSLALAAIFAALFRDYHITRFVPLGLLCLGTGLAHAIPVAVGAWLIVRRGFAVNPVGAGVAAGTLSGLAGVTMLEFHCANFETFHLLLWHTAVVVTSGVFGAFLASIRARRQ